MSERGSRRPAKASEGLLALQRAAGNAAVAALVAGSRSGGSPQSVPGAKVTRAPRMALQRIQASKRHAFKANPSWATKGPFNPEDDCTPFWDLWGRSPEAENKWGFYAKWLPDAIVNKCNCSIAGQAYADYLNGDGTPHYKLPDNGNCVSEQCAADKRAHDGDREHRGVQERLLEFWLAAQKAHHIAWRAFAGGARTVELDFVTALDGRIEPVGSGPLRERSVDEWLVFEDNRLAGGLLLGGSNEDKRATKDSEWGFDTRDVSGSIKLVRTDDGSDPDAVLYDQTITFNYHVHDALDFCPANTLRKTQGDWLDKMKFNQLLPDLSRLEASGMARDIEFDVRYHRTTPTASNLRAERPATPPSPEPPKPGPDPAPPKPGPDPKPRPTGKLSAAVFQDADGRPNPTLEACYENRARLKEGDHGDPVKMVQRALLDVDAGDLGTSGPAGDGVDAAFGPKTAAVVRAFKARESLGSEQYGDVGPGTMHRLDDLLSA